jgi:hypothetical protein
MAVLKPLGAVTAVGGAIGLTIAMLMGAGQIAAIGWHSAWHVYGRYWTLASR